jgi:hypothetical protein
VVVVGSAGAVVVVVGSAGAVVVVVVGSAGAVVVVVLVVDVVVSGATPTVVVVVPLAWSPEEASPPQAAWTRRAARIGSDATRRAVLGIGRMHPREIRGHPREPVRRVRKITLTSDATIRTGRCRCCARRSR